MDDISLRHYAHIGDAVWELFVREYTVFKSPNIKLVHNYTTDRVRASYQAELLNIINDELSENEQDISRRARNASIPVGRRNNQTEYRQSTSFEALIGYWYLNDKPRLEYFFDKFKNLEEFI